jgi:branched-chain amino acid transport system permease protein
VYRLVISAVCIVLAVALYFVIQRTRLGMMIRAGNHDRVMVEALGININMIYRVVFALGVAWRRWPACSPRRSPRCSPTWAATC